MKKDNQSDAATLRQKAEELLKKKQLKASPLLSETEMQNLIHELGVHQIELELQNEELILAYERSEVASEKYTELYDFAPSGYFTLSKSGEIIELNLSGANMLGKERSRLENSLFVFFVSDDTKPIFNHFLEKVFTGKTKESCEVGLSTKDNSPMYVHLNGIVAENGEQCFISAIDITERKQTEEALAQSYDLNALFMRYSPIYAFIKEVTPTESRVLLASENFREMIGIPGSEMVGKTMNELFPTEFAAKITADDWSVVASGQVLELDEDLNGRNFTTIKFPIKLRDRNLLAGYTIDITETKQMELEIRHKNEELQKLNAEKDKFFSIIAHDLKSPFNSFLGLTQIMAEELPSLTMSQVQKIAVSLSNSATNLYRLLENLLQWSRMQQGSIPFNPELLQLPQMIEDCIESIMEPAKNKGIEITSNIPGDLVVFADSNILQTIIRNLVSNAEKFTPKGGKISVSAKVLNDNSVKISVKDTGIGMSQSMVENLFRLDVLTNRKGTEGEPSSGLGLFLCHEFIKKHGGKIWVESEEGKGSEFKFTLPVGN